MGPGAPRAASLSTGPTGKYMTAQGVKSENQQEAQDGKQRSEMPISRHSPTRYRRERLTSTKYEGPRGRRRYKRSPSSSSISSPSRGRSRSPRPRHSSPRRRHYHVDSSSIANSSSGRSRTHKRQCRHLRSNSRQRNTLIESRFYRRLLRGYWKETLLTEKFRKDEVLKQDNWMVWKTRILGSLVIDRLDGFPLGDYHAPEKDKHEYQAWLTLDRAVGGYILENISHKQLLHIPALLCVNGSRNHKLTSAEVWQHLRDVYETYDIAGLFKTLFTITKEGADIGRHLGEMIEIRTKLANANHHFEDHVFNVIFLGTLPESWRDFVSVQHGIMAGIALGKGTGFSTIHLMNAIRAECNWHKTGTERRYVQL